MTDEKNHDGPHVWRESDGLCAIQFCKGGARQEHAPTDAEAFPPRDGYADAYRSRPPAHGATWERNDRGAVGIILALAALILISAAIQVTTDIDPLTYLRAAVDWTATLLTEAWSQIR